jgi:hypothetical protein
MKQENIGLVGCRFHRCQSRKGMRNENHEWDSAKAKKFWGLLEAFAEGETFGMTEDQVFLNAIMEVSEVKFRWRKTSEQPPTEKDADTFGNVLTQPSGSVHWKAVLDCPEYYCRWMPIPPLPKESE